MTCGTPVTETAAWMEGEKKIVEEKEDEGEREKEKDGPFELGDVVVLCTDENDATDAGVTLAGAEEVLVAGEHKVGEALASVGVLVIVTSCTGAGREGGIGG